MLEGFVCVFTNRFALYEYLQRAAHIPQLRETGVLPIYIRLDFSQERLDLAAQVKARIATVAKEINVEAPKARESETLWEYFHREHADFWRRNRPVMPLLVFDQFEEILTLGQTTPEKIAATDVFVEELSDLVEGRPPAPVRARLEASPDDAAARNWLTHSLYTSWWPAG